MEEELGFLMIVNLKGWNSGLSNQQLVMLSPERPSVLMDFSNSVKFSSLGFFLSALCFLDYLS